MVYTEIKEKSGKKYYYRVKSIRKGNKVSKKRVYLGVNLDKKELNKKEDNADKELGLLNKLLTDEEKDELNKLKDAFTKEPKESYDNRYEVFCSQFTYDSTAIEGNTITLQETSQLLFDNLSPKGKSIREINEVLNHKKAFDYILDYDGDLTKEFILELHKLVIKDTLKPELSKEVGKYRSLQVYLRGVDWLPCKPEEVPGEMQALLSWYTKQKKKLHPLVLASYFHVAFETIHPFVDGNGRVGRLLMNFILHKNGYPMINISNTGKQDYYGALEESQVRGNLRDFVVLMIKFLKNAKIKF